MKNYTIQQLRKLRDILSEDCDTYLDDVYTSEKQMFNKQTNKLFDLIEQIEKAQKKEKDKI